MTMEFYKTSDSSTGVEIPYYGDRVAAGFPSPAEDYMEQTLVQVPKAVSEKLMAVSGRRF